MYQCHYQKQGNFNIPFIEKMASHVKNREIWKRYWISLYRPSPVDYIEIPIITVRGWCDDFVAFGTCKVPATDMEIVSTRLLPSQVHTLLSQLVYLSPHKQSMSDFKNNSPLLATSDTSTIAHSHHLISFGFTPIHFPLTQDMPWPSLLDPSLSNPAPLPVLSVSA